MSLVHPKKEIKEVEVLDLERDKPPEFIPRNYEDGGWLPDLNPTQRKIFNDSSKFILGYGEKGCRTLDAQLYTEDGLKRLGGVKPADANTDGFSPLAMGVWSFDQVKVIPARVDAYWNEGSDEAIEVTLSHGGQLTGSPRHPIWLCWQSPDDAYGFGFKSLSEITELIKLGWRMWTPIMKHPSWTKTQLVDGITANLAYALGALVGDGGLSHVAGKGSCVFTNRDEECFICVRVGLEDLGASLITTRTPYSFLVRPRKRIRPLLKTLGLCHLSYSKRIPDQILESPKRVVAAFLRGLFDTDGTVDKAGNIQLCTVSERLGLDVQDVLAAFGILCVRRRRKSASGRPTWTLSIMGQHAYRFGQEIGFYITRKQKRICAPRVSFRCPDGFNQNRYGYPAPICAVMKAIALATRDGKRTRAWHDAHRRLHSFGSVPAKLKIEAFCDLYDCREELEPFFLSDNWVELTGTKSVKAKLGDLHVPQLHSFLASGTINHNSGKSIGFGHKVVRHCYENASALAIIISPSQRTGAEGIWYDLLSLILPQWMEGIGLEASDSKLDPITKDKHIWIANRFGGWSKIMLISIPHASMVRARVKGPAPSLVYIEEITECESREYFNYLGAQLGRRRGIVGPQQFMASCNPDGPSHWVYELFFVECIDKRGRRDKDFSVYHVPIKENLHRLPPGYYESLEKIFRSDEIEMRRLLKGEWLDRPSGDAIFKAAWNAEVHWKGDAKKGIGLVPKVGYPIYVGHDPGPVNYCITFLQVVPTIEGKLLVLVFDELNYVEARAPFSKVVAALLRRMSFWDELTQNKFSFLHIADDSAFNQLRGDGKYDYVEIERLSRDPVTGVVRIKLRACPKGADSVPARVRLIMSKLQTDELYVSARCPKTKEMFERLESQKAAVGKYDPHAGFRPLRSRYLHPFDSMSYPVFYASFGGMIAPQAQTIEPQVYTMGGKN